MVIKLRILKNRFLKFVSKRVFSGIKVALSVTPCRPFSLLTRGKTQFFFPSLFSLHVAENNEAGNISYPSTVQRFGVQTDVFYAMGGPQPRIHEIFCLRQEISAPA